MKVIENAQVGDLEVSDETVMVAGVVVGDVHALQGALVDVRGRVEGNLVVRSGAAVWLRGSVTGDASNYGGTLNVSGSVGGVVHFEAGLTMYFEGASVGGERVPVTDMDKDK